MENFNTTFHNLNLRLETKFKDDFNIEKINLNNIKNSESDNDSTNDLERVYSLKINDNFYILKYNASLSSFFLIQKAKNEINIGETYNSDFIPLTFKQNKSEFESICDAIYHIARYNEIPNE